MSSVVKLMKNLPVAESDNEDNLVSDINYVRRSSTLISDALQKGLDVMQEASGDIVITEVKTLTYHYRWDRESSKFERMTMGSRAKRRKMKEEALEREAATS